MSRSLPERVDILVVGGGIVGSSVLYHLAKAGGAKVALFERDKIASGTTWHAPALVPPLRGTGPATELAKYSCALYSTLEKETGQSTGWRKPGHLNLAASKERLIANKRGMSVAKSSGVTLELVGPDDVARMFPLLRTDDLYGAVWMPEAGRVDPNDTCQALIKGAKAHGGEVFEDTPVTGFIVENGAVRGVRTAEGETRCDIVVNCAGLWGRDVAGKVGVNAPLYACEHFYLLTDAIDGVTSDMPLLRDADAYLYVREDVGGLLVGCFEPNPRPIAVDQLPGGGFVLLNEDWDHFEPMMRNGIHRIPALENAGARALINGPESFTTDHNPLLGEVPEVRGFYMACAMNSSGITIAGGVGWAMSEWVLKGRPPVDLWSHDVRRYMPFQNNTRALRERIPEVLARHHEIPWPGFEYDTVRNIRQTPFYAQLSARGARFSQRGGWERPLWYAADAAAPTGPDRTFDRPEWFAQWKAEHEAARNAVAIFDQSPFAKLLVQGRDAESFLQRMCSNDMAVEPGRVVYTLMLNEAGGIESDPTVTRIDATTFLLVTGSQQGRRDLHWLRKNIGEGEHVTIADVSAAYGTLLVTGPRTRELLGAVSPADFSNGGFPFQTSREIEIGYVNARAVRVSYAGELGWELHCSADVARHVLEGLLSNVEGLGGRLAGSAALNSLRVERGFRAWAHDVGPKDMPREAGLGFTVRSGKQGAFVGRDAVLRARDANLSRRLVSLVFDGEQAFPFGNEPIFIGKERCGVLSSGTFGHTLHRAVGLAWLSGEALKEGAIAHPDVEVEIANERYRARATIEPPYDPSGSRLRA